MELVKELEKKMSEKMCFCASKRCLEITTGKEDETLIMRGVSTAMRTKKYVFFRLFPGIVSELRNVRDVDNPLEKYNAQMMFKNNSRPGSELQIHLWTHEH